MGYPRRPPARTLKTRQQLRSEHVQRYRELAEDIHSVWCGPKQAANGLPWGMLKHLHARTRAGPVNDRDGVSVHAVVHGAVLQWLLFEITGSTVKTDTFNIFREGSDVEERRVGQQGVAFSVVHAAPRRGLNIDRAASPDWMPHTLAVNAALPMCQPWTKGLKCADMIGE